jgi:hypothetical protein
VTKRIIFQKIYNENILFLSTKLRKFSERSENLREISGNIRFEFFKSKPTDFREKTEKGEKHAYNGVL